MNNSEPKFSVGDPVILVGKNGLVYDDNHVVLKVKFVKHRLTTLNTFYTGWVYDISNDPVKKNPGPYMEPTLRPKPTGTGITFTEFMKLLKRVDKMVN